MLLEKTAAASPIRREDLYWLCALPGAELDMAALQSVLPDKPVHQDGMNCISMGRNWEDIWKTIRSSGIRLEDNRQLFAFIPSSTPPHLRDAQVQPLSAQEVDRIADCYWLIDALEAGRLECHYQSIVDRNQLVYAFEAFARLSRANGEVINGAQIIEASKILNIKHLIDRHLQSEAIRTFFTYTSMGVLFVNFIHGFIQLPERYLHAIDDTVRDLKILPKRIAIKLNYPRDDKMLDHVGKVHDFCRSRGYLLVLDQIPRDEMDHRLLPRFNPDIVKFENNLRTFPEFALAEMLNRAHSSGSMAIAEKIENQEELEKYLQMGFDLFQGYYISKPRAVK